MFKRVSVLVAVVLAVTCLASAKDKKKTTLPTFVLDAQTALVLIDPDAAIPVNDSMGNKTAQDDVEKELMKWGRLRPVMVVGLADLVIVIRKGNKQAAEPTISGEPPNDRPVIVQGSDSTIRVGAKRGPSPDAPQTGGPQPQGRGTGEQVGPAEDSFLVYQGKVDAPLERAPVWRYLAKNGLKSPDVPAVAEFKKAVDEAVKQQQKQQPPQPQPQSKP